jgi:hypothetical protein
VSRWPQVRAEFTKVLALRNQIRRAGWFIHENASGVKAVLSGCPPAAASVNHPLAHVTHDVVCDRRRTKSPKVGVPIQLIGHGDHKPPGTPDWNVCPRALSLPTPPEESGRHRLRRSPAPAELVIVDAVA